MIDDMRPSDPPSDRRSERVRLRGVIFIGAAVDAVTGGEKYDRAVIEGLRAERSVESITFDDVPPPARGYLASNRWLIGRYRRRFRRVVIVEDHFWHPRTFAFNWIARVGGARVVSIVHHLYHRLRPSRWQRAVGWILETVALAAAHRVVVNSRNTRDEVAALGVPRSRIVVVPPAVDRVPEPRPVGDVESERPLRLLSVANVAPRKGLEFLIEALAGVSFPFQLEVVGEPRYDASYRTTLDGLIESRKLQNRVVFAGRADDRQLDAAYRSADTFVAPSLWEGFGMAILDALLYGVPVIATRVGAIPELVEDGVHGFLVPPRDAAALAAALERLAADRPMRLRMAERARARGLELAWPWDRLQASFRSIVGAVDAPPGS